MAMVVGVLKIELFIPGSSSLKDKRMVVRSLKDRIRSKFNASVAETDQQDKWQRATLGVATVGADRKYVDGALCTILDLVRESHAAQLIAFDMELL